MNAEDSISEILNSIKGESSKWINNSRITKQYFDWQDEYYATSVSPNVVHKIRNYIRNQESHHSDISFEQEKIELFGIKQNQKKGKT